MNDDADNFVTNPFAIRSRSFQSLCERRYSRRGFLRAGATVGAGMAALGLSGCDNDQDIEAAKERQWRLENPYDSSFAFAEIAHGEDAHHHVAADHEAQILLRWGDPLHADAPVFDPDNQSPEAQLQQFGYNNDYIGYLALEPQKGQQARALLCVNHEYPVAGMMFPNLTDDVELELSADKVNITQAAVGNSIVEVGLENGVWSVNRRSPFNRRISAFNTEIQISGPAAGHPRLQTTQDRHGRNVIGTFNNCAGGMTPWGTFLSCEENFNGHFGGELNKNHAETHNHRRYNVPSDYTQWYRHDPRFDVGVEPNEPNRFGWVVEIDPMEPDSKPKKRTALGRFKHEGAETIVAASGQLVVYMGDDQRFEYLYKFVSRAEVDLERPKRNRDLLDHGTLYVAKFHQDGALEWLPLEYENELLASEFASQAEVLIETRRAADLLGATALDRPEDVVPNSKTGKVYVMLTNNHKRKKIDVASPRTENYFGHIIEISELDNDHASTKGFWDVLVQCGDPNTPEHAARWNDRTSDNGWFANPDNATVDPSGRLWVSTDQGSVSTLTGTADGLWGLETEGALRGTGKMFFRVPRDAEMCGPVFSDDGENLFLAVQHPGDHGQGSRVETATSRWPDFLETMPPRPSIVVIRKKGGGTIG